MVCAHSTRLAALVAHAPVMYDVAITVTGDADAAREDTLAGLVLAWRGQVLDDCCSRDDERRTAAACAHAAAVHARGPARDQVLESPLRGERLMRCVAQHGRRQREVLALCLHGGHDVLAAALVLRLSPHEVTRLLGAALADLASPDVEQAVSGG